jgi:hypothetical protein
MNPASHAAPHPVRRAARRSARSRVRRAAPAPASAILALAAALCAAHSEAARAQAPGAAGGAAVQAPGTPDLTGTPAVRCAQSFVDMINDPAPGAVERFETAWASSKRAGSVAIDERTRRVAALRAEWGALTVVEIRGSSASDAALLVRSAGKGLLELRPEFSTSEPGRLDGMMVASGPGVGETRPVSADDRARVVAEAARALREGYVYPEVGAAMAAALESNLKSGAYDNVADEATLAARLTSDCRAVSKDRHLRVNVAPDEGSAEGEDRHGPPIEEMRAENYAFREVELLPGNVGYLRFDLFLETDEARATGAAAMAFLRHCDALIVDLRGNGGGSPEMIRFLTSYLFEERVHLNDMVDRDGKVVEEYWTLEEVPGARLKKDLPVFVLTSGRTFSGAEEFAYNLKNLERAVIVGETTGGGAHPVRPARLDARFVMTVPFMRAQNPISRTNWEGTGVEPDVKVPSGEALDAAQSLAREAIAKKR